MRRESWPVRRQAYLRPCPACGMRNGFNAARCWRCEDLLPPPSPDALLAAWGAMAPDPRPATASVAVLPSVAVACSMVPRARVFASRPAPRSGEHDQAHASGDAPPRVAERFGAVARDASSPRRSATVVGGALVCVALVVAGYPVYRDAERVASTPEVRRAPFVAAPMPHANAVPPHVLPPPQPERIAATAQEVPRPVVTLAKPAPAHPPRSGAVVTRAPSSTPRHATHAPRASTHSTRTASARRVAPRAPVLFASGVSLHDAAMGR